MNMSTSINKFPNKLHEYIIDLLMLDHTEIAVTRKLQLC